MTLGWAASFFRSSLISSQMVVDVFPICVVHGCSECGWGRSAPGRCSIRAYAPETSYPLLTWASDQAATKCIDRNASRGCREV